jgi:ferredoxin-fold anticodon binding domain-containing protein
MSADELLNSLNIDKRIFEKHVFTQNSMTPEQLALNIAGTLHNQNIKQGRVFASTEEDLSAWRKQGLIEVLIMLLKDRRFEIISDYSQQHIEYIRAYEQVLTAA